MAERAWDGGGPDGELVVEDLLLLLFDPRSGTIAGENTLFYTLGGAVIAELALGEHVAFEEAGTWRGRTVRAVEGNAPADPLLREAWDRVADKPRGMGTLLAEVGPPLRTPVLDRVVARGHVRRERRKRLGLLTTTSLRDGGTGRRDALLARVRPVLAEGAEPEARVGALAALLGASGSLPALHRDIPWSGRVATRAKELERGDWGAEAAGAAVARTVAAAATGVLLATGALTE